MATRRMFSKKVTSSSEFLMMSPSAQALYFHIGMNADDDGICELFPIMRMTESKPDDLRALHDKYFVYVLDGKILFVKDWFENNYIRPDRYDRSKYLKGDDHKNIKDIYESIMLDKSHTLLDGLSGIPLADKRSTEDRIGKDRIGEKKRDLYGDENFLKFWDEYPNKVGKGAAWKSWEKLSPDNNLKETIMSAVRAYKLTDQWIKDGGRFVPHPMTFLNQRRFEDEIKARTPQVAVKEY